MAADIDRQVIRSVHNKWRLIHYQKKLVLLRFFAFPPSFFLERGWGKLHKSRAPSAKSDIGPGPKEQTKTNRNRRVKKTPSTSGDWDRTPSRTGWQSSGRASVRPAKSITARTKLFRPILDGGGASIRPKSEEGWRSKGCVSLRPPT